MSEKYNSNHFLDYNHVVNDGNLQNLDIDSINKEAAFSSLGEMQQNITDNVSNVNLSINDRKNNLNQLKSLYDAKNDMLKELDAQVGVQQDRFNDTNTNKINQQANLNIVNSEIDKTKEKNEYYNDMITNKVRNIQINTFYQKKYNSQISLLKFIIVVCILIILLSFVKKSGFLNETVYAGLVGLIIFISIVRISYLLFDIFIRDKNNFDEIDNSWVLSVYNSNSENTNGDDVDDDDDKCSNNNNENLEEPEANDPNSLE